MTMLLYRPTGIRELELIAEAGWLAWPPRLPDQPIFYPVITVAYAAKIAREWNAIDAFSGHVGFVTRFQVSDDFAAGYPVQEAGGHAHKELWVPAADLPELNRHIRGFIEVVAAFAGPSFARSLDPITHLPDGLSPPAISDAGPGFSCPCCRHFTLAERSGFEICPVCFWEDDGQDDLDADDVRGGPNGTLSLTVARAHFAKVGASSPKFVDAVRSPLPSES